MILLLSARRISCRIEEKELFPVQVSAPVTGNASRQEYTPAQSPVSQYCIHWNLCNAELVSDIIYIEERGVRCGFKWCKTFGGQSVRKG